VGSWWMGEFKPEGWFQCAAVGVDEWHCRDILVRNAREGVSIPRTRSSGAIGWDFQPGIAQARKGDFTQLVALDEGRAEGERVCTAQTM
jgi:hypothetical protein